MLSPHLDSTSPVRGLWFWFALDGIRSGEGSSCAPRPLGGACGRWGVWCPTHTLSVCTFAPRKHM